MKYLFIFLVFYLLGSCKDNCREDSQFKEKFFNNISLIQKYYNHRDTAKVNSLDNRKDIDSAVAYLNKVDYAVKYNSHVTNIYLKSYGYESVGFDTNPATEMKEWIEWYDKNKCNMSLAKADSIYFDELGVYDFVDSLIDGNYVSSQRFSYLVDSVRKSRRSVSY